VKGVCLVAAIMGMLALGGCMRRAVTVEDFSKDGVSFSYDSDWTVAKDADVAGGNARSIEVKGPNNALVMLECLSPARRDTLEEFAKEVAEGREQAVDRARIGSMQLASTGKVKTKPATAVVSGHDATGLAQHFPISVFGVDVPHEARFFLVEGTRYRIVVMTQVAEASVDGTRAGMDLILKTLRTDGE